MKIRGIAEIDTSVVTPETFDKVVDVCFRRLRGELWDAFRLFTTRKKKEK